LCLASVRYTVLCALYSTGVLLETDKRYASLDGDADRVVFFFEDNGEHKCCTTLFSLWTCVREFPATGWRQDSFFGKNGTVKYVTLKPCLR